MTTGLFVALQAGADRLVASLKRAEERRANFHRRRVVNDTEVDSINEANRRFNKKIDTKLGKYSIEIKQSLERGTA